MLQLARTCGSTPAISQYLYKENQLGVPAETHCNPAKFNLTSGPCDVGGMCGLCYPTCHDAAEAKLLVSQGAVRCAQCSR